MSEFNPSRLVTLTMELLDARYGIRSTVDNTSVGPAVDAAADLLRALGVTPTTIPSLPARDAP